MKALHHVGITVKDLDASIRFYHDVLGLQFANSRARGSTAKN
jgi:catechol 2,3-dioxygenase-like lactoylglutathione lyase family enzyme